MKKAFKLMFSILLVTISFSHAQICDQFVGGYVPSYRDPATVDYSKLSHAFYGFAGTNPQGGLIVDQPVVFSSFKTSSTGKQRFLSLAGGGGAEAFSSMTSSSSAIQSFADSCAKFCVAQNFQDNIRSIYCSTLKVIGITNFDLTGILFCFPGIHFGNFLTNRIASRLHDGVRD
jgi:hypothetical protein